ncbi:MAG: PAS domain S-box protein [Desulfuromonadales bacterium]|nr:PAS domain S-box protein [Desulfuromonadales bacterium]
MTSCLEHSALFKQSMIDALSDPVFIKDRQHRYILVNEACCALIGAPREKIMENNAQVFLPELENSLNALAEKVFQTRETQVQETLIVNKQGQRRWGSIKLSFFADSPDHAAVIGVIHDITAQKSIEEELRKLTRAVEQSPTTIVITDLGGTIEFVNPKFTQLTGYSAEEALGQNPRILKSGKTSPETYVDMWQTITAGKVWEGELLNKAKDGSVFWEHTSISPLRNQQGEITHFLSTKEDITEKKRIQEQLNQAQKIDSIGRLAGGIAHDFNNMLTTISGNVELALRKLENGKPLKNHLLQIKETSKRSADLTRQLLGFARKQTIRPKILDLNQSVNKMLQMLQRLIGEDINLSWSPAATPMNVLIDPSQLDQILTNLVANARDAIATTGTLVISSEKVTLDQHYCVSHPYSQPGDYVRLNVSDDGCGISSDELKNIFDPFFTTKAPNKGTGIGLSTVYGIVRQNHGSIEVYTEVGRGTTFSVYLPFLGDALHIETPTAETPLECGHERILLVEDDPGLLEITRLLLEDLGYQVSATDDWQQALEQVEQARPPLDLLLTDVIMPGCNGKELAEKIHARKPELKVLYMSGYATDIISSRGLLDEGVHLLRKPFTSQVLANKLREVLDPDTPSNNH